MHRPKEVGDWTVEEIGKVQGETWKWTIVGSITILKTSPNRLNSLPRLLGLITLSDGETGI